MQIDLTGKRAVVCGGSRGIGRAIALVLAQAGADVSICARGAEALEATRRDIAGTGRRAHAARAIWVMRGRSGAMWRTRRGRWAVSISW